MIQKDQWSAINKNYLQELEEMHKMHQKNSSVIQEKFDDIIIGLDQIFNHDEEFLTCGLPLINSTNTLIDHYLLLNQLSPKFILDKDPVVQDIKDGLFALCERWFVDRASNAEFIGYHFSREDFNKISKFFFQLLKDTNTDPDSLSYWNYIY